MNKTIYQSLCRKKTYDEESELGKEKLERVLNAFDLTALGIGATLGSGVYILAGTVAKSAAGPAVIVSFIVAAIVSSFSGVCYAEFAGRVPKAGSAYIYSYVAVGEFVAFVIGWNLVIEHTIGTASVAKALTNYLDTLLGSPQRKYMKKHFPMQIDFLSEYPDIASLLIVTSISIIVAWGVRKSSTINNIFTTLNLLTVMIVIVSGFFHGNMSNWFILKNDIPSGANGGDGGFMPFGWTGVFAGAARCFYGFIGFDSIATTGEETKNPKKTIPLAIGLTLFFVTLAYCGVAAVLTLMWPYYDQDVNAPLPAIYEHLEMPLVRYMVTCSAVFALFTTLLVCLFPIPRILYAMSSDGLLFHFLSRVNDKTKTPLNATLLCGIITGLLSSIFNLEQLVDMTSIGTLVSYLIVSICILILRYKNKKNNDIDRGVDNSKVNVFMKLFILSGVKLPNKDTQFISRVLILIFTIAATLFCFCIVNMDKFNRTLQSLFVVIIVVSAMVSSVVMIMLYRLPQAVETLSFKVPFVPLVPCISIILNLYLMMELHYKTWIRFGSGLIIGIIIYVFYGYHCSLEGVKQRLLKDDRLKNRIKISQ